MPRGGYNNVGYKEFFKFFKRGKCMFWIPKGARAQWYRVAVTPTGQYQVAVNTYNYDNIDVAMMVSNDYGNTWSNSLSQPSNNLLGIAISSTGQYQTVFDAIGGLIYVSNDYGATWVAKDSNRSWQGISISSTGQYQAANVLEGQIYVSSDYGATWVAKDSVRLWVAISISSTGQYQAAVGSSDQIYESSDYGNTWVAKGSAKYWASISVSSTGQYQ